MMVEGAEKHKTSWSKLRKKVQKSTEEGPERWKDKQKQVRPQKPWEATYRKDVAGNDRCC